MTSNAFIAPHFQNDKDARAFVEAIRWPDGVVCPHCGSVGRAYATKREGVYRCAEKECRKDFSVTTGTVMESSHIGLHKWLMGFYLMSASKKGISAHQLHRALGITYKSAWFMAHRIREAMRVGGLTPLAVKARSWKRMKPIMATFPKRHAVSSKLPDVRSQRSATALVISAQSFR
jgi:transposase-like protein